MTTLYNFCSQANCADGQEPNSLVATSSGTLYGTTFAGGASNSRGTIFKVTPSGAFSTLHTFCTEGGTTCAAGAYPGGLFQASDGNLYGGTSDGGANAAGTVFKISPAGVFQTVYNFCAQANCADGGGLGSLIQASDGNFYGTTGSGGGPSNEGTFFKLTPGGVLTVLFDFCPTLCPNNPAPGGFGPGDGRKLLRRDVLWTRWWLWRAGLRHGLQNFRRPRPVREDNSAARQSRVVSSNPGNKLDGRNPRQLQRNCGGLHSCLRHRDYGHGPSGRDLRQDQGDHAVGHPHEQHTLSSPSIAREEARPDCILLWPGRAACIATSMIRSQRIN